MSRFHPKGGLALILAVALAPVCMTVAQDDAAPDAADNVIQIDKLEFKFERPRTVIIYPIGDQQNAKGVDAGRIYWYLRYSLTNTGKDTSEFFVTLLARSDKDRTYADLALPVVEKKIERIEGRELHSKGDVQKEGKLISTYEEYASGQSRNCVAIFNPIDPEADFITVDVHGLVNDIETQKLEGGVVRVQERVLRLKFARPGDEFYTSLDQFTFKSKEWVKIQHDLKLEE
ncbi:MAG: hypothetical protein AAF581_13300 [Planctomycetota bacterium]